MWFLEIGEKSLEGIGLNEPAFRPFRARWAGEERILVFLRVLGCGFESRRWMAARWRAVMLSHDFLELSDVFSGAWNPAKGGEEFSDFYGDHDEMVPL